jgi:hypothetical protein
VTRESFRNNNQTGSKHDRVLVGFGYARDLAKNDVVTGGLNQPSRIRPNRLFTADSSIVLYAAGRVREGKLRETANAVIAILSRQWRMSELGSCPSAMASFEFVNIGSPQMRGARMARTFGDQIGHLRPLPILIVPQAKRVRRAKFRPCPYLAHLHRA